MPADEKPDVVDDCSAVKSSPDADFRKNDQLIIPVKSTSSSCPDAISFSLLFCSFSLLLVFFWVGSAKHKNVCLPKRGFSEGGHKENSGAKCTYYFLPKGKMNPPLSYVQRTSQSSDRRNTHDVRLVEACFTLKPRLERVLDGLLRHYECQYALVSFSDNKESHVPCIASRTRDGAMAFPIPLPHFRGTSFCQTTLQRPIPVIISPLRGSGLFSDHPLVVGYPHLTSFVGVPLVVEDAYVGSLCMFWTSGECVNDVWAYAIAEGAARAISDMLLTEHGKKKRPPKKLN